MATFNIVETTPGIFEIQRNEPVAIAVIHNRALADAVLGILEMVGDELLENATKGQVPAAVADALPRVGKAGLHVIGGDFVPMHGNSSTCAICRRLMK